MSMSSRVCACVLFYVVNRSSSPPGSSLSRDGSASSEKQGNKRTNAFTCLKLVENCSRRAYCPEAHFRNLVAYFISV